MGVGTLVPCMKFLGCPDEHLHVEMSRILPVIDYISSELCGRTAIITSTTEGRYIRGNKHSEGLAVDLRIIDLPIDVRSRYYFALNYALRKLCHVVYNANYIHVEYNPSDY